MSALSTAARDEYYAELANSLPTPVIHTRENCDRRLATAVEAFEALRPADAYEARLAVRIVLCGAHAAECFREADCYRQDYAKRTRCRAQAAGMMRGEGSAKRMLEREQKVRLAVEAVADGVPERPAVAGAPPQRSEVQAASPPAQAALPPVQAASPPSLAAAVPPPPVPVPPAQAASPAPSPDQAAAAVKLSVRTAAAAPPSVPVQPPATPPRPAAANRAAPAATAALARADPNGQGHASRLVQARAAVPTRQQRCVTPPSRAPPVALPSQPIAIESMVRFGAVPPPYSASSAPR